MKKLLIFMLLLFASAAFAQIPPQITGAGAPTNPCINGGQQYLDTTGHNLYVCPSNGANWVNIGIGNATATVMSGNGAPTNPCAGNQLWVNYTSGALYTCNAGSWALVSGGGGSGTVSANNTAAGAMAEYAAAAGSTTVGPTANLVESPAGTFTHGVAGTTGGVIALAGATSGTSTFTPNAVAGTTTNPVVSSNSIKVNANGTASAPSFVAGASGGGIFSNAAARVAVSTGSTEVIEFRAGALNALSGTAYAWCSNAVTCNATAPDTGISRSAANVTDIGNGTAANETGLLRSGMPCRITGAVTLSTSSTNICSWSLPAVAQTWAYDCNLAWAVTAGTTPTIAFQINASQAPTSETAYATIYTTNTGTFTQGSVTATAAGAQTILTSPSLTTSATVFQSHVSGTVQSSATAGTFAVAAIGVGASFAGTVAVGSQCTLY